MIGLKRINSGSAEQGLIITNSNKKIYKESYSAHVLLSLLNELE